MGIFKMFRMQFWVEAIYSVCIIKEQKKKRNVPARFKQYVHICLSTKDSQPYDWNPEKERGFSKEAQISSLFCPLFFSLQITTKRTDKWRNYKNDQVERNTKQEVKASKPVSQPAYIHAYRLFQMHHRIFFFLFFSNGSLDLYRYSFCMCSFLRIFTAAVVEQQTKIISALSMLYAQKHTHRFLLLCVFFFQEFLHPLLCSIRKRERKWWRSERQKVLSCI